MPDPGPAQAAPGDLDPAFSADGRSSGLPFSPSAESAQALDVTPGGAVLAGLGSMVVRLAANGEKDLAFGDGGSARTGFPGGGRLADLAVDPLGRIVIAGYADGTGENSGPTITRLLPNGSLDAAFAGGAVRVGPYFRGGLRAVEVAADGRVFALGYGGPVGAEDDFVVALTPGGAPDPSFSGDGIAVLGDDVAGFSVSGARALSLSEGGGVLVSLSLGGVSIPGIGGVMRLTPAGVPDPGFSSDGVATLGEIGNGFADVEIESTPGGGAFVVSKAARAPLDDELGSELAAVMLLPSGEPDVSFGIGGAAFVATPGAPSDIGAARRAGGGWAITYSESEEPHDFELIALTSSGAPDPAFSADGRTGTDVSGVGSFDFPRALEVDAAGRILVFGDAGGPTAKRPGKVDRVAVTRHLDVDGPPDADADGVLDPDDLCPERWGDKRRGCLVFKPKRVRVEYERDIDDFRGTVLYQPAYRCNLGGVVKVFAKRAGRDRLVGRSEKIKDRGEWSVSALAPPGRYYARLVPRHVSEVGFCGAGRSKTMVRR